MLKKKYVATVQIVVDANNEDEACDAISGVLDHEGVFDWGYVKIGGQYTYPVEILINEENYEEGDFLN